tara:strand:+ start:210 stop:596 length:387 start_codon:yes stop_codon:yes gene_type:complete
MSDDLFEKGKQKRTAVLGSEYVSRALDNADEFSIDFQKYVTESAWGFCWSDETLDMRTRSLMNLTMIAALGKMDEFVLHVRGALKNGVTKNELKATIHIIAVYVGVPAGVQAMNHIKEVLKEDSVKNQ